ncbi:WD repeat-containing protein 5 isoform X2 [Scleropages formosus]|nr:WD repeat-containing protein 5-like isoform X2 [Scleropages formosus]
MGEVRKVQKKLRQIENLEIKASLTKEERDKISRKEELRSRLAELLLQLSAPQRDQGIVGDEKEKMKRRVKDDSEILVSRPPPTKVLKEGSEKRTGQEKEDTHETETQDYPSRVQIDTRLKSLRASWEGSKFRLRLLEGHNDLVTCVVAVDNMVVSGSRDTTVKVWHVPTATEQRNLGGHSGGVTCLFAPLPEYCRRLARSLSLNEKERFVISGSVDCTVRIWALSTGLCVKSIYTFNAVSTLCFVPEGEGFIVTGSDGGKVEVWSWDSMQNCQSVKAHEDSVTTLQSQGPLVFSGSADGGVSVWEVHHSSPAPLQILHRWSSCVTGCGSPNEAHVGQLALSPRGDRVFLADGKANLKILNWRTGSVSRLANHSTVAGVTDCVSQTAGILIGSCFDLATGDSTLNLFSLPQCEYLVSLTCHEYPRILCFAAWLTPSGGHRWVTGGRVLTVWEQLPTSTKQRGDVTAKRNIQLEACSVESDPGSEEDDDDDMDNYISQDAPANDEEPNSSWLRCALQ